MAECTIHEHYQAAQQQLFIVNCNARENEDSKLAIFKVCLRFIQTSKVSNGLSNSVRLLSKGQVALFSPCMFFSF